MNIVIFSSSNGGLSQHIVETFKHHESISIVGFVTDRPCGALSKAKEAGVPSLLIKKFDINTSSQIRYLFNPSLILLCGFKSILSAQFIKQVKIPILNSHPSLLPKYGGRGMYGVKVHQAVKEAGDTFTGCSIHVVNEEIDSGKVLMQTPFRIKNSMTAWEIGGMVHELEKTLLCEVITKINDGLIDVID